jgi:hypothetical protein
LPSVLRFSRCQRTAIVLSHKYFRRAAEMASKSEQEKEVRIMKKTMFLLLLSLPVVVFGQGIEVPPRHMIDLPTAWPLPRAGLDLTMRFYGNGGLLMGLNVGVSGKFMFGASYGGSKILGEDSLEWNPAPGLLVRYLLINESFALPAISIGFDSQGYGAFLDSTNRYGNKSLGFYAVASKSYAFLERMDFHGGINYSLEHDDHDSDINLFVGGVLAFNPDFDLLAEYDFAVNDNADNSLGSGNGYVNAGLRLNIKKVVYLEFFLKNLLQNKKEVKYYNREFKITYFQYIL